MKTLRSLCFVCLLAITPNVTPILHAKIITVTTTNNVSPAAGQTSLLQALRTLSDGDEVRFNISGTGPFYIASPAGGYPLITNNNITMDGYTQPGSSPNTNPILAPNNAKIKIVLDSRNGNATSMDYQPDNPSTAEDEHKGAGFGADELAILGVFRGKNFHVQGLCFLGNFSATIYGLAIARDYVSSSDGAHVSGCWMGVDLDGKSVFGFASAVSVARHRDINNQNQITTDNTTVGVKAGSTNAPAQFNVFVGLVEALGIEGNGARISGNFVGVFPDGVHDYNGAFANIPGVTFDETHIEIGRGNNNTVIGTDGDGVNDENERNIIGGVVPTSVGTSGGYTHTIEFYGNNPGTNIVIAGNYIGVGIDGTTWFTNGVPVVNGSSAQFRLGSDFNGVSDAVEGNLIVNNYPPELFPASDAGAKGFFDQLNGGGTVSLRGNSLVNNFPFPVSPVRNAGADITNYYTKALVDVTKGITPTLSTNTSVSRLVGTVPLANTNNWPTTIIDLYAVDQVGLTNGQAAFIPELPNGFLQGAAYIGSFVDNGPNDRDKKLGSFDFDISALEAKGALVAVTANYVNTNRTVVLTSPFSAPMEVTFVPGSIESVGLRRTVADTVVINPGLDKLGNWEPYASVLGNSVFLIEGNTFATNTSDQQRFVVYFQPVNGGPGKLGDGFFADNGQPFRDPINLSRQNGNPGRVAGDKRPGAVNFIVGAETSAGQLAPFQSDRRWTSNNVYGADNRYGTVQTYSLDTGTLAQSPLTKAFDAINGRMTGAFGGNTPEVGRFGGEVAALDDGNFVVVVDDRSDFLSPAGSRTATVVIIRPNGSIVKETYAVDASINNQIWSNVAAFKGGFCVRFNASLYFYDNAGNLKGQVNQNTSGETYDGGRGDGTRIAAHINSPYVYLVGKVTTANLVKVAVWDSRDQSFQAKADVSEGAFTGGFDRANLAVDALNRVTLSWVSQPAGYELQQVAARVLAFNPGTKSFTSLTKSFFPFINAAQTGGIHSVQMTVAMTTRQIMVAAKGEINLGNNPSAGADSPSEVNFFTVFSHPDPQNDPTTPIGGGLVIKSISTSGPAVTITWTGGTAPYLLQRKNSLSDTNWINVLTTSNQTAVVANVADVAFFRVADKAQTTVTQFTAWLTGAAEVPPVTTGAAGFGTMSLEGNQFTFQIRYAGLSGPATVSHFHGPSPSTGTASPVINLTSFLPASGTSGTISGTTTLTTDQITALRAGVAYANIHTAANGGGEIRGQVVASALKATLSGAAEVPAVTTTATGSASLTLVGNQLFYNVTYSGLSAGATASHIHGRATTAQAVGVLFGLGTPTGTSGTLSGQQTLTVDQLGAMADGMTYVNVHSSANPSGEIRGQVGP